MAMVLGIFQCQGRPTYLDTSRVKVYCACSRCGTGLFWTFFSPFHISLLSLFLWETARHRLTYCLKEPLHVNQKQPIFTTGRTMET